MRHQLAVELGQPIFCGARAQQAAKDVVQAEEAPTEIQVDQQRQLVQAGKEILAVKGIKAGRLTPQAESGAGRNLGILDEDGELGEAGSLRFAQLLQADLERAPGGAAPRCAILWREGVSEPALRQRALGIAQRIVETAAARRAGSQHAIGEAKQQRPFAEPDGEGGQPGLE